MEVMLYAEDRSLDNVHIWTQFPPWEPVGRMTRTVMVALMNIDDAYDKDLHFVFPSRLQTTKDKYDRGLQREEKCATHLLWF